MSIQLKGNTDSSFSNDINISDKISLNTDGSANFAGPITSGSPLVSAATGVGVNVVNNGYIEACRNGGLIFRGFDFGNTTPTSQINADGSATFSQGNIKLNLDGSADLAGGILEIKNDGSQLASRAGAPCYYLESLTTGGYFHLYNNASGVTIQLNGDLGTGTFTGNVTSSNITAFKTALTSAVTASTDHASLKAAILSALASL
jgi:hypothetical protein